MIGRLITTLWAFSLLGASSSWAQETSFGETSATDKSTSSATYCQMNTYIKDAGVQVYEYSKVEGSDLYVRCNWISGDFKLKKGQNIGLTINCPNDREIVSSGYFLGSPSMEYIKPAGVLSVIAVGDADRAQALFYVQSEHPANVFQVFSTAMCRK